MRRVLINVARLVRRSDGQDLVEYGLLMAVIAVAALIAITNLGNTIHSVFWDSIAQNF